MARVKCSQCKGTGIRDCKDCSGRGEIDDGEKCNTCGGTGKSNRACTKCEGLGYEIEYPAQGDDELVDKGVAAYRAKNYTKAVKLWRKAADMAPSNAQQSCVDDKNQHGVAHNKGYQDEKMREDFSPSSAPGIAVAQLNMGTCYYNGKGVPEDNTKAFEWYLKSAEQGHAKAMYNVGVQYLYAWGVEQDLAKAEEWLNKAIANGYNKENAEEQLATLRQDRDAQ